MSEATDALNRIDALVQIAIRIAQSAASGRIALTKLASQLHPSWIPAPWDQSVWPLLAQAGAQTAPPLSFSTVEGILRDAWGVRKLTDELDSIDPEPVAVRPTSQVHRAVRDGRPVAVKVLRPGLAGAVRADLVLLDGLLAPLAGAFPGIDPGAILAEVRERVMDEFDLENEAAMQRRFHRALRKGGPVMVPEPIGDLSREHVLVSEWIDGTPLSAAVIRATFDGPDGLASRLLRFVIGGLREGLVHCDLDLDDVLVLDDGRLAVLDYGAAAVVPKPRADVCLAVVEAFIAQDAAALGAGLEALGLMDASHGALALSVATDVLGELGSAAPSRLDIAAVAAGLPRLEARGHDAVTLLLNGSLEPGDIYPARAIGQLLSVIARCGATGIWREEIVTALRGGWVG